MGLPTTEVLPRKRTTGTVGERGQPPARNGRPDRSAHADAMGLVAAMADVGDMTDFDAHDLLSVLRTAAEDVTADRGMRDTDVFLSRIVGAAAATIAGVCGAGVSHTENGTVASSHGTTRDIATLDALQSRLREGPCVTAAADPPADGIVLAQDLAGPDAARWPRFADAAVEAGYRSVLSVGLSIRGPRRTALNLYARDPDVFDPAAQLSAGIFGLQAAALLHGADNAAQLGLALETRDVIGQAKGIRMERFTATDDAAFELLVASSQDTNMKLVEVARWVTRETNARGAR